MSNSSSNFEAAVENRERAVQIIIYDLQGGPFPEAAFDQIERDIQKVAETYNGLAITVVRE